MIPFGTEVATVITIVLIGAILNGYVSILKRNGWIGKPSVETGIKGSFGKSRPELKTQNPQALLIETKATTPNQENEESKVPKTDASTDSLKETKATQRKKPKKTEAPKQNKPSGCNHNFGYLSTLPKMTATPEECYFCTKLLECYKETKN